MVHSTQQKIIDSLKVELRAQREPFENRRFALRYGCDQWYWGEVNWRHRPSSDGKEIWYAEILNP